jgi:hypothetical protein
MDYGEEMKGEGESNYTHSAPDNSAVVAAAYARAQHRNKKSG